jgi:beta-glucosidase
VIDLARNLRPYDQKARDFIWAAGIEDTFVPQTRPGHNALDEYELMGHYDHWREDLALCRDLGLQAVRWGIPWYKVEPEPGRFDWSWADEVIPYIVEELKIAPIIDLMHYGCPFWLDKGFISRDYPRRVADFAAAVAERYRSLIKCYTPLNEPIITALMCGMRSLWPPYLRGEKGYIKIMLQVTRGIVKTVNAITAVDPDAVMFYVEATGLTRTIREDLTSLALEETHRGYICFDLLTGKLSHDHLLFSWLLRSGVPLGDLLELQENPVTLDVLGMNFYPQWSTKQIYLNKTGHIAFREAEPEGEGFSELIKHYHERYQVPIMITETSALGGDDIRMRWLQSSVKAIKSLRESGIPVVGYTWFPLFTMVDWRYRFAREPFDRFYLELGLYRLNRKKGKRWLDTSLVSEYQKYVRSPRNAVGDLKRQDTAAPS